MVASGSRLAVSMDRPKKKKAIGLCCYGDGPFNDRNVTVMDVARDSVIRNDGGGEESYR